MSARSVIALGVLLAAVLLLGTLCWSSAGVRESAGVADGILPAAAARGPLTPGDAPGSAPMTGAELRRAAVAGAPSLEDFAPEQRPAAAEILRDRATVAEVKAMRAEIDKLAPDDLRRPILEDLLRARSSPRSAIVECSVIAADGDWVHVIAASEAPELGITIGQRCRWPWSASSRQRAILQRHGPTAIGSVVPGQQQSFLVAPDILSGTAWLLVGPPHGPSTSGLATADEPPMGIEAFESEARPAVHQLVRGQTRFWTTEETSTCGLVRCRVVAGVWGGTSWRAEAANAELGIAAGDRLSLFDHLVGEVRREFGLPDAPTPKVGEVRTLVVHTTWLLGLPHHRWLLLASPPQPR